MNALHKILGLSDPVECNKMREQLSAIQSLHAIAEIDADGKLLSVNEAYADLFDCRSSDLLGSNHSTLVDKEHSSRYQDLWRKARRGETVKGTLMCRDRDGQVKWLQVGLSPMKGDDDRVGNILEMANDVTEQHSAVNISYSLSSCRGPVMLIDQSMQVNYVNDALTEMLIHNEKVIKEKAPEFSASKVVGRPLDWLDRDFVNECSGGQSFSRDIEIGALIIGLSASPWRDIGGKRLGTVLEWVDKTEMLAAQARVTEAADANVFLRRALAVCNTSLMLADTDYNITYVNQSSTKMMADREDVLRGALPSFRASELVGRSIDSFHQNPELQRQRLSQLKDTDLTDIKINGLTFGLITTPIFNDEGIRVGTVVEWDDKTDRLKVELEEAQRAAENKRIKEALDVCDTSVMLADNDLNITYLNKANTKMMTDRESGIRDHLPNFKASTLIGTCVDDFHVNPAHQRGMIKGLNKSFKTDIKLGELTFGLIATPLFDDHGERLGTVVEWNDRTERLAVEKEEKMLSASNLRIKQALDVCEACVMVADDDLNIVYMNEASVKMMRDRESGIREHLPNFTAKNLIGTCVDDFHVSANHQRKLLGELQHSYSADLKLSGLIFGLIATPIFDAENHRIGTVVEWDDKTERVAQELENKRIADENARVREALDNVTANVMIADNDANIIYLNKAVQSMMRTAESDLKKELPNFDSSQLLGKNIDSFHRNPHHQRNIIQNLTQAYHGKASAGGRSFTVIANPVFKDGERVGTVVEWADKTAEMSIESEIDDMVDAASKGEFTRQISCEGKDGFFLNLSKGLNDLVGMVEVALNDVIRMLGAMAKGDLSERITRDYAGAFGQLKADANSTADKLTEVIGNIRISSKTIATSADEIAQGNADLSQRTEEQASSLEETASSMEEMTSTVKQSSENATEANTVALDAQERAREGGLVVQNAVSAMDEINQSSKKIADIIGVIDEIAFQTNLLALNAAVEAARAGEQGRGFAVVAGEVRNLAQRSAAAAKEIKDLIRDSVSKVDDGTELVNKSGQTLSEIVSSVNKVTQMVQDIALAAREQTSGIEQVNTAISQMDEMTQQNAALVEQASAAGQSMADQAKSMTNVIAFFSSVGGDLSQSGSGSDAYMTPQSNPEPQYASNNASASGSGSLRSHKSATIDNSNSEDEWEDF